MSVGLRRNLDHCLAHHAVQATIIKRDAIIGDHGLVILAMFLTCYAAYLEYIDEICIEQHLHREVHRSEIEILEGHAIEKYLRSQQLFAADVDCVFRQVERVA